MLGGRKYVQMCIFCHFTGDFSLCSFVLFYNPQFLNYYKIKMLKVRGLPRCLFWETKTTCHMETFQKQGEDYETLLQRCLLIIHPASFPESTRKYANPFA